MSEELSIEEREKEEKEIRAQKVKRRVNLILNNYFGFILIGIAIVVLALGYFLLIRPKYDKTIKAIDVYNRQEEESFTAKKKELLKVRDMLKVYNDIEDDYKKKIYSIAPLRENKEEIFSEVNYLVNRNGLILQSISLSETGGRAPEEFIPKEEDNYISREEIKKISISLSVRGTDYEAFKNFLSALENNLPMMDVVNLNFDPAGESSTFLIDTYYIQDEKDKKEEI
jgi:Tfp pilus assembly protein PilO